MKKIAAISLLALLLFNFIGYRFVYRHLEQVSDEKMEASLDAAAYDEADLREIKIPINLPYQNNWKHFERYDGEISIEGKQYKYVNRKIENDTLYIKVIPHRQKEKIREHKLGFFKSTNDLDASKGKKSTETIKIFSPEFRELPETWSLAKQIIQTSSPFDNSAYYLIKGFHRFMERPPEDLG